MSSSYLRLLERTNIYNFKNTFLLLFITFCFLKETHQSLHNFADSTRFNVGCCHIIPTTLLDKHVGFLSRNFKECYRKMPFITPSCLVLTVSGSVFVTSTVPPIYVVGFKSFLPDKLFNNNNNNNNIIIIIII